MKTKRGLERRWIWILVVALVVAVGIGIYFWLSGGTSGSEYLAPPPLPN